MMRKYFIIGVALLGTSGCAYRGGIYDYGYLPELAGGAVGALVGSRFGSGNGKVVNTAIGTTVGVISGRVIADTVSDTIADSSRTDVPLVEPHEHTVITERPIPYCERRYFTPGEISSCNKGRARREREIQRRRERAAEQRGYNRSFYWRDS